MKSREDIVKGLECCLHAGALCDRCPYCGVDDLSKHLCCADLLLSHALELIKSYEERLKAPVIIAGKKPLSEVRVGDTFKIGVHEFIVLEQRGADTVALSKNLIEDEIAFGDTPEFAKSNVKKILDKFAVEIASEIGDDNLMEHAVDQTTLDGIYYYDMSDSKMSLMTIDHVRKYANVLDNHKVDKWYWLVTPWSTPARGWERAMCAVAPSGFVYYDISFCSSSGVRPFCILKSDIFVS